MKKIFSTTQKINITIRILFILAFFETIVFSFSQKDSSGIINAFTAVLGFSLTFIPETVENITKKKVRFSDGMKITIVIFIFCAEFLGEIRSFYEIVPWWDNMLHFLSGIILGLIGFILVYALNESNIVTLKPIFIVSFAFFFALSCGVLWEIFEFSGDRLLGLNMQKFRPPENVNTLLTENWSYDDGLKDTMTDIIMDAISAFITSILGFIKIKAGKSKKHQKI